MSRLNRLNRLNRWMLCLLLLALPCMASATSQIPDSIEIDGQALPLNTNPLTAHLRAVSWTLPDDAGSSSANWRGYLASWRVEGDELVLVDATIRVHDAENTASTERRTRSIKAALFPGQDRVVATWYSGALIIPDGTMTRYVHMGYASTYDHYQVMRVVQGKVTVRLALDGKAFQAYRRQSFDAFADTAQFRAALADTMRNGMSEAEATGFLRDFHSETYLSR